MRQVVDLNTLGRVRAVAFASVAYLLAVVFPASLARAQQADTSNKMTIFLTAKLIIHNETDSGQVNRFLDSAVFRQGTDTLYCDSLYQNKTKNIIEAFGDVRVAQAGGTQATCNYLRYETAKKLAYMRGSVTLTDGKNKLWCDELTYDLGTKVGTYNNNGRLQADSTTVTSNSGVYDVKGKEARFMGNVVVKDPRYKTTSEDMGYNTDTKLTHFYAKSVVVGDSGKTRLQTTRGEYDAAKGMAHFTAHSSIWYDGQYIEGDTLFYDRAQGYGYAYGHIIAWDTSRNALLYCGHAEYFQRKRVLWALNKPVLVQINGPDTIYVRADTFYSAPAQRTVKASIADSLSSLKGAVKKAIQTPDSLLANQLKKTAKRKKDKVTTPSMLAIDTSVADSTAPLCFIGYHHVRIFSDSLQGVCDSIVYTQSDSSVRMIYKPIVWARKSQVTGDTIVMQMDSGKIRNIYIPNNAFVVSQTGPDKAELYDQVQGKILKGYFKNNTLTELNVYPNAESIYYPKDDSGAFIGVTQASGEKMRIFFKDQKIQKIRLEKDVHQTLTPLQNADLPNTRLSRFKWIPERRPKSKGELFW